MKKSIQIISLCILITFIGFFEVFATHSIAFLRSEYTLSLYEKNPRWGNYDNLIIEPAKLLLTELPYQYDIVNDQFIERDGLVLNNYKLLIIPNAIAMSALEYFKIEDFIQRGGNAFITGTSGIHDTNGWIRAFGLSSSMGVRWPGYEREISEGSFWNIDIILSGDPQYDAVLKGIFEKQRVSKEDSTESDILIKNGWEDPAVVPTFISTAKLLGYWTDYNLDSVSADPRGENSLPCALTCNRYGTGGYVIYFDGKLFSGYKYCREIAHWAHRDTDPCQNAEKIAFNIMRNYTNIPKSNLELASWWIYRQHHERSWLVDSYEDGDRDFGHNGAFLYDQALTVMVYCALANDDSSKFDFYKFLGFKILKKLQQLQNADGSFYFSYLHKDEPIEPTNRARYSGANAWLLMAINKYEEQFKDSLTFRGTAMGIAKWLCTQLDTCKCPQIDPRKPTKCMIVRGGIDASDQPLTWHSVEHNLDAYAALAYFGYLTHDTNYTFIAQQIRRCLESCAWESTQGHFLRGLDDSVATMDVNPWGILALGDTAWLGYDFTIGLNWALDNCRTIHVWEGHWDPNPDSIGDVEGFDFNDDKDVVWVEGTESMALALHLAGYDSLADYFHHEMAKLIPAANDGGLPYSTNEGTIAADDIERSTTYPSVAGTAWFIFKELNYNPFEIPPEAHPEPDTLPCPVENLYKNKAEINDYRLCANYPNPFNQQTKICYQIGKISDVNLSIFNINGQLVKTLVNSKQIAGNHEIIWNGKDENGKDVASGLYIYCLNCKDKKLFGKALLIR